MQNILYIWHWTLTYVQKRSSGPSLLFVIVLNSRTYIWPLPGLLGTVCKKTLNLHVYNTAFPALRGWILHACGALAGIAEPMEEIYPFKKSHFTLWSFYIAMENHHFQYVHCPLPSALIHCRRVRHSTIWENTMNTCSWTTGCLSVTN
jgi:hypothetical protein